MIKSIIDYLNQSASRYPEKTVFIDREECVAYRDFNQRTLLFASALLRQAEADGRVATHKPVVVFMDKCVGALTAFMGIVRTGGIYTPFDSAAPVERLNLILKVIEPSYIITDAAHAKKAQMLLHEEGQILLLETLLEGELLPKEEAKLALLAQLAIDTDPLYIICTSGSTGIPKGVVVSHRAVIDFTEEASERLMFSEHEVFASQAPFYFDASVPDIYCTLRNGACLHILPASMYVFPVRVLEYLRMHQVNAIFWVPSALVTAANLNAVDTVDITCLKKVMFCGEVMPVKQYHIWKEALPDTVFVNYYGPSEATYASTYYIIDREFENDEKLPIGNAAANTGILVLNSEDRLVDGEEAGELCIRGSGLASGYYNNPEKTRESFVQNPLNPAYPEVIYRTGDLVHYNQFGELEYMGRKDFQIKHQGYRIELGEIEMAAGSLDGVEMCACVYDHDNGRIVMFYTGSELEERQVQKLLVSKLPKYMVPGRFIRLEQLPFNSNGKVDRKALIHWQGSS